MDDFRVEDFIRRRLLKGNGQVSQGLNLVLRLENPLRMPQLLLEIAKRQREVDQALDELKFVHFARFLPTHRGDALQVITTFDGELEPYAMDFAIAIGDVFSAILSFVADRPPLPVRDHPEEFWAFIKRNNRVRVINLPLPEESYYPVYSAYPAKTVLDIVGPTRRLPMPATDRPPADIDLADVQGNLLENFRAGFARHFIFAVVDAALARPWLAALARGRQGGVPKITTAADRYEKPRTMLNIGFTYAGLEALGVRMRLLASFPEAFRQGPADAKRATANGDTGPAAPEHWIFGKPEGAEHLMLSLYVRKEDHEQLGRASAALRDALQQGKCGLSLLSLHDATALDKGREHFGFRDGISQPRLAGQPYPRNDMQPAASPGEFLLGADYKDIYGGPSIGKLSPKLATNGTFCAVRVLAQDVVAFNSMLEEGERRLGVSQAQIAAKLVGRWFDGQPLATHPEEPSAEAGKVAEHDNAFDYAPSYEYPDTYDDHDGMRCPIGAHIRRVNPRGSRVAGVRYSRRVIRRGMPYSWPAKDGREEEKGIFGLFYCGSLERQFEFIQQQWVQGDVFASGIRGSQDPIAGSQTLTGSFALPGMGDAGGTAFIQVPRLTTTRGSLYLFMPGIKALQELGSGSLTVAPLLQRRGMKKLRSALVTSSVGKVLARAEERFFGPPPARWSIAPIGLARIGGASPGSAPIGSVCTGSACTGSTSGRLRSVPFRPDRSGIPGRSLPDIHRLSCVPPGAFRAGASRLLGLQARSCQAIVYR